jgi:hypothetical protein
MSNYPAVHVVGPEKFNLGTAQTPGSERLEAIAPKLGVETAMWGGLFEVARSAHTGIHHHGEQQTIAYVLSGICEVRWGKKANMPRRPKPATSSMCLLSWSIWKSTCRIRCLSDGWWFGVLRRRLSLIFLKILGPQEARRTRGWCSRAPNTRL